MRKLNLLWVALLGIGTMVVTSCSNDVVSNDVDSVAPETKAPVGAFQVKKVTVTQGDFTSVEDFTFNTDNKLTQVVSSKGGISYTATVTYPDASTVKVSYTDPNGYAIVHTYTLNANGFVTDAETTSDGVVVDKMQFTYRRGFLQYIKQGEDDGNGNWTFAEAFAFAYGNPGVISSLTEQGTVATCTTDATLYNMATIDLNFYSILVAGAAYSDLLNYAIYADLLPNTSTLVTKVQLDASNKNEFTYTQNMVGQTTACKIVAFWQDYDDNDQLVDFSATTNVTFGY